MTESNLPVWGVRCWDTKNNRYCILSYIKATKAEAYATCVELNPGYDVEAVFLMSEA